MRITLLFLLNVFVSATSFSQGNFQVAYNSLNGPGYGQQMGLHYMLSCTDSTMAYVDTNGSILWTRHYPFSIENFKVDGNQRMWCGGVEPFTYGVNAVMALMDSAGTIIWKRSYNSTWNESRILDERIFNNQCYFHVFDDDYGLSNIYWYYKLNDQNDSTVQNSFAHEDYCFFGNDQMVQLNTNIYTYSVGIRRTDTLMNPLWTSVFSDTVIQNGIDEYNGSKIVVCKDSSFLVGGYFTPVMGSASAWLMKIDMNTGDSILTKQLGPGYISQLISTVDGGFAAIIINGGINLTKLDSALNIQWTQSFPGMGFSDAVSLEQTLDDGFLIGGYTYYTLNLDTLYPYLIKTDSNGNAPALLTTIAEQKNSAIHIYPNPFSENARITGLSHYPVTIKIYNEIGELVKTTKLNGNDDLIDRKSLSQGIYFYTIQSEVEILQRGKLIVN